MDTVVREVERKYDVAGGTAVLDAMETMTATAGVAAVSRQGEQLLDAVYYDTADLRLIGAGITLRRRTGGQDAGWHLKLPGRRGFRKPCGQLCRESVPRPAAVRAVQDRVNFRNLRNGHTLNVDGIHGPETVAAVQAFQQAMSHEVHGFLVDGIAGRKPGKPWSPGPCRLNSVMPQDRADSRVVMVPSVPRETSRWARRTGWQPMASAVARVLRHGVTRRSLTHCRSRCGSLRGCSLRAMSRSAACGRPIARSSMATPISPPGGGDRFNGQTVCLHLFGLRGARSACWIRSSLRRAWSTSGISSHHVSPT